MDIGVNIAGIEFKNPVILASGPLSNAGAALFKAEEMGVGGVVTKSATLVPSAGNPAPRTVFGPDYVINADGIRNQGYRAMAGDIEKARESGLGIPVIASAAGASPEEFVEMALEFERQGASAVELNLVCPNRGRLVGAAKEETLGRYWTETPERSYTVVKAVKDRLRIPVWAKFPFDAFYREPMIARRMEEAGLDAAVVTTTMPRAMAIDIKTGQPRLGNPRGAGAVGGRIMKPLGITCVSELARTVKIPVIATGGVFSGLDVIEYAMVGAAAVEVLTAFMHKVPVSGMLDEIKDFMAEQGYGHFRELYGKTLPYLPPLPGNP